MGTIVHGMVWLVLQLLAFLPLFAVAAGVGERLATVVSVQTDEGTRTVRLERQRELRAWFDEQDRHLPAEAACRTELDRRNTTDFAATMSNFQLLALPRPEREQASAALADYAKAVSEHGEAALLALFPRPPEPLLARWRQPPTIKAACLEGVVTYAPAAVYVPGSATMYLDFNQATGPAGWADAFEHELWHHLVPSVQPPDVGSNLLWEGFNEALAELWGAELRRRAGLTFDDGPVRYPVPTALASLCLAADREGTLAWLLGRPPDTVRALGLTARLLPQPRLDAPHRRRLVTLLAAWNWHQDDGSPPLLDPFLLDGAISPERVRTAFRVNRPYLAAFSDALAVVWLQDALAADGRDALLALGEVLPPALRANLARTLNYLRNPDVPLR